MKESVTKFNLEAAFKALDEIEIPVAKKGIAANKVNLKETFNRKSKLDLLLEDYYDVNDTEELEAAKEAREAEVAKAKLARIEKIVDLNAESEEDLLPSYVGKMIIQCPQCMTLFYKNEEDIARSEEDPEVVNVNEVCQHCGNASGYSVIGKVDQVGEEEAEEYDLDAFEDENELDLDFPEGTEEVDPEGTGEDARDNELDLEPVNTDEEETTEEGSEEEVKESLTLNEDINTNELDIVLDAVLNEYIKPEYKQEVKDELLRVRNCWMNLSAYDREYWYCSNGTIGYFFDSEDAVNFDEKVFIDGLSHDELYGEAYPTLIDFCCPDEEDFDESLHEDTEEEFLDEEEVEISEEELEDEEVEETEEVVEEEKVVISAEEVKEIAAEAGEEVAEVVKENPEVEAEEIKEITDEIVDNALEVEDETEEVIEDEVSEEEIVEESLTEAADKEVKIAGFVDCSGSHRKDSIKNQINILKNAGATEIYYFSGEVCTDPESAWQDGRTIYSGIRDWVENNPEAKAIVTTDSDIDFNDGHEIKNHDRIEIIRIDIEEPLTEAVDKELDDKLKAHNEYVEYLKDEIEKTEKSLENAKNDFVKKSIQSKLDALKADLEAALPEALKDEVVADELPTPEESGLEDAAENKEEEVKESLIESTLIEDEKTVQALQQENKNLEAKLAELETTYKTVLEGERRYNTADEAGKKVLDKLANGDYLKSIAFDLNEYKTKKDNYEHQINVNNEIIKNGGNKLLKQSQAMIGKNGKEIEVESLNENVIININVEGEKEEAPVIIPVEANVETGCLPEAECPVEPIVEPEPFVEPQPEVVEDPVEAPAEETEADEEISEEELEDEEIIEEACEPLTEEDNFDLSDAEAEELFNSDEFKQPISEEEVEGYLGESSTFESVFEEIDELDDESIQNCIRESLTEVYSNVENFVIESCEMDNNTFKINGTINFKSGNTAATSYVFNEAKYITEDRIVLNGINETLSKDGNFVLEARVNPTNKSMVANTLSYSYKINNNLVEGLIKNNK